MDTKIEVKIFGQQYQIKAGADSDHIKRVAQYVDEKMREIASATPTVDTLKIAVLAALNITDEFFQLRISGRKRCEWGGLLQCNPLHC